MTALVRATIGAAIVLALPGALIASILRMRFRILTTWAAVPMFSLAGVFVLGEITTIVHAPFGVPAFVAFIAILAVGVLARRRFLPGAPFERPRLTLKRHRFDRPSLAAYGLLSLGIGIGVLTWTRGLYGEALGPARNDGSHHAYFVKRIIETQTFELSKVLVADPLGQFRTLEFYPLGTHASATIATSLVDADIGRMLIVLMVSFAAVVLPLGMFVLARTLAPEWPLVAGFTALIVPVLSIFPYQPSTWGGVALIVGMSMLPISVVLVKQAVCDRTTPVRDFPRFIIGLVPAALALLAAVSVHSTQLPLIVFLVILLALEGVRRSDAAAIFTNAAIRGAFAFGLTAVLFAPTLLAAGGGISERSSIDPTTTTSVDQALGPILTLHISTPARQGALAALALSGVVVWLLTSRRLAWVLGWAAIVGVTLLASVSKGTLSRILSLPWYHIPQRVNYNQVFFVAFFAAVPLAFVAGGVARLLRSQRWLLPVAAVVAALFIAVVGIHGYRNTKSMLHNAYAVQGVRPASLQAYNWLGRHSQEHDTVINDAETDGSLWMYPYARLNPLFGFPTSASRSDQSQRIFLRNNIASVGRDPSVDDAARKFRARWIYLDTRTFPNTRHSLNLDAIKSNPNLVEVFRHRTVHVFKVEFSVQEADHTPPTTDLVAHGASVLGQPISGKTSLLATASDNVRVSRVDVYVSSGDVPDKRIGTAKRTYFGWQYDWDTRSVQNGIYTLTSVAVDPGGNLGRSPGVNVVVQNK
jgi:Bacterial Ig domain